MVEPSGVYRVTCGTIGCDWQDEADTECTARLLGAEHEEKHPFHTTVVLAPDAQRDAA